MTNVQCDRHDCRRCMNGMCTRRRLTVRIEGCYGYVIRKAQFRNVTTTIYCDVSRCKHWGAGMCSLDTVTFINGKCRDKEWLT